jgi:hypothetical protein
MSLRCETGLPAFFGLAAAAIAIVAGSHATHAAQNGYRLPPENAGLIQAPGVDLVAANCAACHSLDYISTQPPRRGNEFWQASVTKMIRVYGAPIAETDVPRLVAYLAAHY